MPNCVKKKNNHINVCCLFSKFSEVCCRGRYKMQPQSEISNHVSDHPQQMSMNHVNVSFMVLHSAFSLVTLGAVLYWFFSCRGQNWQHFRVKRSMKYSSEIRTLLTLTVLVVCVFNESEAILSSISSSARNIDVHVANSLALCGTAFCIVICALSLEVISVVFHFTLLLYWTCCALLEVFRLVFYFPEKLLPFSDNDARLLLSFCMLGCYVTLVIFEVVVLVYQVRIFLYGLC